MRVYHVCVQNLSSFTVILQSLDFAALFLLSSFVCNNHIPSSSRSTLSHCLPILFIPFLFFFLLHLCFSSNDPACLPVCLLACLLFYLPSFLPFHLRLYSHVHIVERSMSIIILLSLPFFVFVLSVVFYSLLTPPFSIKGGTCLCVLAKFVSL